VNTGTAREKMFEIAACLAQHLSLPQVCCRRKRKEGSSLEASNLQWPRNCNVRVLCVDRCRTDVVLSFPVFTHIPLPGGQNRVDGEHCRQNSRCSPQSLQAERDNPNLHAIAR
jgi:hypothetical protein